MAEGKPGKALQPIIVIKKIKKRGHGGHHGGAWKIAYADFVTAMMAFFLLMWLLSYTDPGTRAGIADYFNRPLKSLLTAGPGSAPTTAPKIAQRKTEEHKKTRTEKARRAQAEDGNRHRRTTPRCGPSKTKSRSRSPAKAAGSDHRSKESPDVRGRFRGLEDYTKVILDEIGRRSTTSTIRSRSRVIPTRCSTRAAKKATRIGSCRAIGPMPRGANSSSGGMNENKILQVRGLSGSVPLDKKN